MKLSATFIIGLAAGIIIGSYTKKPKRTEQVNKPKNETFGI